MKTWLISVGETVNNDSYIVKAIEVQCTEEDAKQRQQEELAIQRERCKNLYDNSDLAWVKLEEYEG